MRVTTRRSTRPRVVIFRVHEECRKIARARVRAVVKQP